MYLRQEADNICTNILIFSKAILAPNKELSIPRLELLSALIGVRCMNFVEKELKLEIEQKHAWLDSQCVLKWIGSTRTYTRYVQDRLNDIRSTKEIHYHYIASSENPADFPIAEAWTQRNSGTTDCGCIDRNGYFQLLTTGQYGSLAAQKTILWNRQEMFLRMFCLKLSSLQGRAAWTIKMCQDRLVHQWVLTSIGFLSSVTKQLRITALAQVFISKLKRVSRLNSQIDSEEIRMAETLWTRYVQKKHCDDVIHAILENKRNNIKEQRGVYLDSEDIMRCRGRLENADLTQRARLPVLLPKTANYTTLVIDRAHRNSLHAGVSQTLSLIRQRYWIPGGRSAVKSVLLKCSVCRHYEGGP